MTFETIRTSVDERGVATLTLARPQKHNAIDAAMIAELTAAAASLAADERVRVVVLRGEGNSFCAGGDLKWMQAQFTAPRAERIAEVRALAEMLRALNALPKPLVAAVHGNAYGGGVGLLCVCDLVIALAGTQYALTETRIGLIPATIGPYVVARIGEGKARRIFFSPRPFDAAAARDLGIVSTVVDNLADLTAALDAEVGGFLQAAPQATAAAKALARSLGPAIDDAVIAATVERLADTWEGPEAQAGVAAFLDKRKV